MNHRHSLALEALNRIAPKNYILLGEGASSVVFHDTEKVYKVYVLHNIESLSYKKDMLSGFRTKADRFQGSDFLYPIESLTEIDPHTFVLVYPYEASEPCQGFTLEEMEHFMADCWQRRLIFQDIKPDNFIRVKGKLKWIDYEPDKFTDNLFLNMAARAFIYATYGAQEQPLLNKLTRSAINHFDMPELAALPAFMNRVFSRIVYCESQVVFPPPVPHQVTYPDVSQLTFSFSPGETASYPVAYRPELNPETLFFDLLNQGLYLQDISPGAPILDAENYFRPECITLTVNKLKTPARPVSLLIKACVQDAEVIYEAVRHIVRQTASPDLFHERILALDTRTGDFLRPYHQHNTWEQLCEEAQRLLADGLIHRVVFPAPEDVAVINRRWFGLDTSLSHTVQKVPVAAQLYAFEQAACDLILQVDCDAMIGRLDPGHSFLGDMIAVLEQHPQVLSVGFNVYQGPETFFKPYTGLENGGFVPEVRFCLLDRRRIRTLLPLPNQIAEQGLALSWYRSLEQHQKTTHTASVRGGSSASFFIHPPNFKKADKDVWFTTLDRVEQGRIPAKQAGEAELAGSYYDWTGPERKEKLVVITCLRNVSLPRFLRFWYSLLSQRLGDWGLVLIDDASDNGLSHYIRSLIKPWAHRVSFVHNRFRMGEAHNTYKAIHYFVAGDDTVIVIADGDDALIGRNALKNVYEKYTYHQADVVIGKMYRSDKLHPHYAYTPDLLNPRLYGGNVWQHLRSFRKYLFDSLGYEDLKIQTPEPAAEDILLANRFNRKWRFPEHCCDYAYMVPIVEMSVNPMIINHFNYFHDRTTITTPALRQEKDEIIRQILAKPRKSPADAFKGRQTFLPNFQKIEIDITYACNLKCINCNRSSTQAPTAEVMDLARIEAFITESIHLGKCWELINLLGGEPTLHPQFQDIVRLILDAYIEPHAPHTLLQITSNGYGPEVQAQLGQLPRHPQIIIDYASFKDDRTVPYFSPFNLAPADDPHASHSDYHKGCWVTSYCGIGLNQLGYYPCGVAGGIDRVFRMNKGAGSLAELEQQARQMLDTFCRYCGNFSDYAVNKGNFIPRHEKAVLTQARMSPTWKNAYKTYNGRP
ncbi:MAG: glycosyltransferase [Bacteroidia bacterium]|nr:glycosyltransferase [Bacteroidia bacterium]